MKKILMGSILVLSLGACQQIPQSVFSPNTQNVISTLSSRVVYRVLPNSKEGGWDVKKSGSKESLAHYRTKEEAINNGRILAKKHKKSQLVIHKRNGQIEKEYTYGDDPRDIPG